MRRQNRKKGFSLVETVLAMGIVAFAMMGILGMVPLGLSHFREAMTITAESQIVQGISNDLLLADYDELVSDYAAQGDSQTFYYDDQGEKMDADGVERIYTATVEIEALNVGNLTGSSGRTAVIEITSRRKPDDPKYYVLVVPSE